MRRPAVLILLVAAACTGSTAPPVSGPSTQAPTTAAPSPPPTGSPTPTGPVALLASLPAGCDQGAPDSTATVSFVADGRAWAVTPEGSGLTCLFEVDDPGPFEWGPLADRVLLGELEVRGVGADVSRSPETFEPSSPSWGRPTGKAIVFVDPDGERLEKTFLGNREISDISPLAGMVEDVAYHDVVYHPSGLAIGFVADHPDPATPGTMLSEVWMSSNTGVDPKRLVFSEMGTQFGPIAFSPDGLQLYYVALLANGTRMLATLPLEEERPIEHLWEADSNVISIFPPAAFGDVPSDNDAILNVGTDCDDSQAVVADVVDQPPGPSTPVLADTAGPTRAFGWLDRSRILVGVGGCGAPVDLWVADVAPGGVPHLLVQGIDQAAIRVPDPTPTPDLPAIGVQAGVG